MKSENSRLNSWINSPLSESAAVARASLLQSENQTTSRKDPAATKWLQVASEETRDSSRLSGLFVELAFLCLYQLPQNEADRW